MLPNWAWAAIWGLVAGSALVIGAAIGYWLRLPQKLVAGIMAFGSGVLISALAFDLMQEAYESGGFQATALGFLAGSILFTVANRMLSRWGATHRKRSGDRQPSEGKSPGSGSAIAVGALLDGVPESMVIGLSLLQGGSVSVVAVTAIFISNIPEALSSAAGMRQAGRSPGYVFGVWGSIALASSLGSLAGFTLLEGFSPAAIGALTAIAAGAILSMLVDTMIPEAFEEAHDLAGVITVAGFLAAFALSKLSA
jgi:zinc transporter, ZIP family